MKQYKNKTSVYVYNNAVHHYYCYLMFVECGNRL